MSAGLRAGYKQTEVGVIPEDWDVLPIAVLTTEFRGGAPLKPSDFTTLGVKVLPKGGVGRTGVLRIADKDIQYCSIDYANAHPRNQVDKAYTIVVLRDLVPSGPSIGLMVEIGTDERFVLAQGVYGFKVDGEKADARYLIQLSNTRWYRNLANGIMVGSTQVHITNTAYKRAELPVPPLPEQRAIAAALSDVDALLGGLDRLIAKKQGLKVAAMQQLLTGQTRLPGFSGEWEVKRLWEIGVFLKGSGVKKDESQSGSHPCIRYGEIYTRHNDYIKEFHSFISAEVAATARLLKKGDLLFAGSGETKAEIGKCVAFVDGFEAYAGGDIVILRPMAVDSLYLGFSLNTPSVNQQKASRGQGDAVVHIGSSALADVTLNLPSLPEQTAIAAILSDMDAELAALQARRSKTQALKQAMMQALLTGQIRLVTPRP